MSIYIPTYQIADERVLTEFYKLMANEAKQQGFSSSSFPLIGDLTLGELMESLRSPENFPTNRYQQILKFTSYNVKPESQAVSPYPNINSTVLRSWQEWITNIGTYRAERKLHQQTLRTICEKYPDKANDWQRASELAESKQTGKITRNEREELRGLEHKLDPKTYSTLRETIKPGLVLEQTERVAQKYKLPTGKSFAQIFEEAKSGLSPESYLDLVKYHANFHF